MAKMATATTAKRCRPLVIASRPNNKTPRNDHEQYIDDAPQVCLRFPNIASGRETVAKSPHYPVGREGLDRSRHDNRSDSGESALEHGDLAHVAKSCGACVGSLRPQNENAKVLTQLAIARAMMRAGKPL
ncbi:hypothetical protein ACWTU6_29815 [Mesorhizobium sp. BHbsci]